MSVRGRNAPSYKRRARTQRAHQQEEQRSGSATAQSSACDHPNEWEYTGTSERGGVRTHHYKCPKCLATDTATERI